MTQIRATTARRLVDVKTMVNVISMFFLVVLVCPATAFSASRAENSAAFDLIKKGKELALRGDYEAALVEVNKGINIVPESPKGFVFRANVLDMRGDLDAALKEYARAISIDPNNDKAFYERGLTYSHKGMYTEAIKDFTRAIEIAPSVEYYYGRAAANYKFKKFEDAAKDLTKVVSLGRASSEIYYKRGLAYMNAGNDAKAMMDFSSGLDITPMAADIYYERWKLHKKRKNEDHALRDSILAEIFYNVKGVIYFYSGNVSGAEKIFLNTIEKLPDGYIAYINVAYIRALKKDEKAACEYLTKSVERGFDDFEFMTWKTTPESVRTNSCFRKFAGLEGAPPKLASTKANAAAKKAIKSEGAGKNKMLTELYTGGDRKVYIGTSSDEVEHYLETSVVKHAAEGLREARIRKTPKKDTPYFDGYVTGRELDPARYSYTVASFDIDCKNKKIQMSGYVDRDELGISLITVGDYRLGWADAAGGFNAKILEAACK